MKKSLFTLAMVIGIFGTTTVNAHPNRHHHHPVPQRVEVRHHHKVHPRVERVVEVRPAAPRTVVVHHPQPVPAPAPRPVVVVERRHDNVATAAVVGGIIGGVIGGVLAR